MKIICQKSFRIIFCAGLLQISLQALAYIPLNTDDAGTTTKDGYLIENPFTR